MSKVLVSKCCGLDYFYWLRHWDNEFNDPDEYQMVRYCPRCHKPCEVMDVQLYDAIKARGGRK